MASKRPALDLLSQASVRRIVDEAFQILDRTGIEVQNERAVDLLRGGGARVDGRVFIPGDVIEGCLRSAPKGVTLYDRSGKAAMRLRGRNTFFNPGSAAIHILDGRTGEIRKAATDDLVRFARLTDALEHMDAQSTALIASDVPVSIGDRYRLFIALRHSRKPVVTGTFAEEGFRPMVEMLAAVAGSPETLRRRPMAIFDACPSPPLKWSRLTSESLIECALMGLPAEIVSMPLAGATAPVTLAGAIVQHTAECLSGVVIHQLAGPGSPVIYGGSPAIFDMRTGTTPMGAIETMMIDGAACRIGRMLGLPTHAYMGLSDAKALDPQSGLESGMGILIASLCGVNLVSGPGMLDFESCQSMEKLVIDHEICGMARRMLAGIRIPSDPMAPDLSGDLSQGDLFLTSGETLRWMEAEHLFPGATIDRSRREDWQRGGGKTSVDHARECVAEILRTHEPERLPDDIDQALREIMEGEGRRHGMDRLPGS